MGQTQQYIDEINKIIMENTKNEVKFDLEDVCEVVDDGDGTLFQKVEVVEDGKEYCVTEEDDLFMMFFEKEEIYLCFNIYSFPQSVALLTSFIITQFSEPNKIKIGSDYCWTHEEELLFGEEAQQYKISLQKEGNKVKSKEKIVYH